ncbi:hypothetical protein K449DRAFT_429845 [Hypoxylon sp. EC38]|nr:hypothetical protein K449DRAFT_429845 [Hypoxylon sp. EC38]
METLVALGLAANVVQFVDFAAKLISISNELRNNAASSENRDHQVLTTHLETLAQSISDSVKAISQASTTASREEQALQPVADKCCELAKSLLIKLDACSIQPNQGNNRTKRVKTAFKAIWNKKEIEDISNRLEHFKNELILYYAFQTRKTQLDQQAQQSNKDDIQAILDKLDDIGSSINETRLNLDAKLNAQHSKLLSSVDEVRTENSQFHTRTAQQAASNQSMLLDKLDDLNMSMTSLNVGVQTIQTQQSSTFESLAQVRVENSTFHANMTQQLPLDSGSSSSLRIALRPLFEEYADKIVEGAKKEFRSTARSEMDNFLKNALPALDEMQYRNTNTERDHRGAVYDIENETDQHDFELRSSLEQQNSTILDRQAPREMDKNSITMLYQKRWRMETKLGILFFIIRDRVHFSISGHPTRIYELITQFSPSPRWFSTGLSITYEKRSDARGSPDFGLRLKAYRVLDEEHEVWRAICSNDISGIQCMLSNRLISTSDREFFGWTLLHSFEDWYSICQLVDLDFNIPGEGSFLETLIRGFTAWLPQKIENKHEAGLFDKITMLGATIQLRIGSEGSADTMNIPVAYAASCIYCWMRDVYEESLIANEATPALSVPYRGHYVHPMVADCLKFLEYVISKEITRRPDCIFDTYKGMTASNWLYKQHGQHIWEEILGEHGFDVDWVYKEGERRKRVVTGETSAHEVSVGVDGSSIRDARRRRGYENPDE